MSYLLRLRLLRYRQTPYNLKRVKAHAIRREPSTIVLDYISVNFADFPEDKNQSGRFNVYVCLYHSQPIGIQGFKGSTILLWIRICYIYAFWQEINLVGKDKDYFGKFQEKRQKNPQRLNDCLNCHALIGHTYSRWSASGSCCECCRACASRW